MPNNIPTNQSDVNDTDVVLIDKEDYWLTHYVLAERLIQVEYANIEQEIRYGTTSDTLTYILEGGFRGFHKYSKEHLREEWLDGAEDKWYQLYDDKGLRWEPYEDDPINKKLIGDPLRKKAV
jgi:hypothetical protein